MTLSAGKGYIKIVLNEKECLKYNITELLKQVDSEKSHKILMKILYDVSMKKIIFSAYRSVIAEVYPMSDGGCIIYYIPNIKFKIKNTKGRRAALYFDDADKLMDFSYSILNSNANVPKNSLYTINDKYALDIDDITHIYTAVYEFCEKIYTDKLELHKLKEYGIKVCDNAIESIGRAESSRHIKVR